jgi:CRISPR-associated endonuclease Cas2
MMDYWIIAYDISEDTLRTKVSNRLIYVGLTRVQYSVFVGATDNKILADFIVWFQTKILTLATSDCSLLVVPLSNGQMQATQAYGNKPLDKEELLGLRHTLII